MINEVLKKREDETKSQFIGRIYKSKVEFNLKNEDCKEIINQNLGTTYAESTCRSIAQPYNEGFEDGFEKGISQSESSEKLKELQKTLEKMELEKKKIQTLNIEKNRFTREGAREELYWEQMINAVGNLKPFEVPEVRIINASKREGLLCVSDMHYGRRNIIRGLKGEIISEYNVDIFKARMWDLLAQAKVELKKEHINKLTIDNLSDCIDGVLRISQLQSLQRGICDSVLEFSEFMATWLNEFSKIDFITEINYHQCWGNHDEIRVLTGKKGDFPHENVSKLIMAFIELRLKDNPKVKVYNNGSPFIYQDIQGMKVFGYHGEDKSLVNAVRWFRGIYNVDIDMIIGGHLHSQSLTTEGIGTYGDVQCIRVSSICGIDDYSMSLRSCARAGASLFIFEEGKGKIGNRDFWLN